jgi:nucleotide-binding universal stress UspA family protein
VQLPTPVEVVHRYRPEGLTDLGFSAGRTLEAASTTLKVEDGATGALQEMPEVPEVMRTSLAGSPANVLVERTDTASQLVIGGHGQTELGNPILGLVGRQCLLRARCPMVVVGLDRSAHRRGTPSPEKAPAG